VQNPSLSGSLRSSRSLLDSRHLLPLVAAEDPWPTSRGRSGPTFGTTTRRRKPVRWSYRNPSCRQQ